MTGGSERRPSATNSLVPVIFDRYARKRLGSQAIANQLNAQGHRTRSGRPWSYSAVLTVLRNRVYLGEVFFRDTYHPAPHPPLVDAEIFDAAQRLMTERGEDAAKRAANSSDYLLTSVLVCAHCGKPFVGTAANGNRYRYYTCYSRQRYGTKTCNAERLPADELDEAVLNALLASYNRHDLIEEAIHAAWGRAEATRDQQQAELTTVDADIAKTEQAIDRYLLAFETGDLPQAQCGERIRNLGAKIAELRDRRTDLADALEASHPDTPSHAALAKVRARVKATLDAGPNPRPQDRHRRTRPQSPRRRPRRHTALVPAAPRLAGDKGSYASRIVGPTGFEPVTSRV